MGRIARAYESLKVLNSGQHQHDERADCTDREHALQKANSDDDEDPIPNYGSLYAEGRVEREKDLSLCCCRPRKRFGCYPSPVRRDSQRGWVPVSLSAGPPVLI